MSIRMKTLTICGTITIVATILISALSIFDWSGVTPVAFAAILISEIAFFLGLIMTKNVAKTTESVFTRVEMCTALSLLSVINIPIAVLFILAFKYSTTTFAIIEIIVFSILTIFIALTLSASKRIRVSNDRTMAAVSRVESCIDRLQKLACDQKCHDYAKEIKSISDDLRFTDISVIIAEDSEIESAISNLEHELLVRNDSDGQSVNENLALLNTLISRRKISTSTLKKGKI